MIYASNTGLIAVSLEMVFDRGAVMEGSRPRAEGFLPAAGSFLLRRLKSLETALLED